MNDYCGKCGFNDGIIEVEYDYEAAAKELGYFPMRRLQPNCAGVFGEPAGYEKVRRTVAP
ncbi:hypothetical protein HSX37_12995|nr:hypothetical protein [Dendrosporobacter quercicolus]NSL48952.1 hypothetical protein [Dendrosporobacter quercicolus DSM 1736]